jgi:hypothetical protein
MRTNMTGAYHDGDSGRLADGVGFFGGVGPRFVFFRFFETGMAGSLGMGSS